MSQQSQVADWANNLANQHTTIKWTNNPSNSSLTQWAATNLDATNPGPLPPLDANLQLICYEFPLYAAAQTGALSLTGLRDLYVKAYKYQQSWDTILNNYWFSNPTIYNINTHIPNIPRGNIVFFNDTEHIAMSLGKSGAFGNEMVVSLWGFTNANVGQPVPLTVDSIESLVSIMKSLTKNSAVKVGFATAPW